LRSKESESESETRSDENRKTEEGTHGWQCQKIKGY